MCEYKYNYSLLIGLSPDLTQVAICPIYHEPSIFVSANVMDRSIGIDNPCLSWADISQANTVSFESDYGCPGHTARISIPPIEPNLVERARIFAVNLDDYQLNPLTPPPSPSSPFTMATYQRMIAETDPTQREESLTEIGQNSVLVPEIALTELEAFMTLWDVNPRVEESSLETPSMDELITQLRKMCEDAEDHANAQPVIALRVAEALAAAASWWTHEQAL
ncbi:hypothetical protein Tco_1335300 [Tanacetum coccineum]